MGEKKSLTDLEEDVLEEVVEQEEKDKDGLRIDELSDLLEQDYIEVKQAVHNLWRNNLLISNPRFGFETELDEEELKTEEIKIVKKQ